MEVIKVKSMGGARQERKPLREYTHTTRNRIIQIG